MHLTDEELIERYYEEALPGAGESHLQSCVECRARFHDIRRTLQAVNSLEAPEPVDGLEARLWARIAPDLPLPQRTARRWWAWPALKPVVGVAAAVVLVAVVYVAGRDAKAPPPVTADRSPNVEEVRERVWLSALDEHLERSRQVISEIRNTPAAGRVNIESEKQRAEELIESSRLYRQTAGLSGDEGMANALDEIERVLLEIAHSPSQVERADIERFQKQVDSSDVVFKIRALNSDVRNHREYRTVVWTPGLP